ncbi:MAG: hypothetical protein APR53_10670 [Methanoculleus sp. SDB]|nr:MAG: hypothetical protein APR53_10670 [Methanoculleus sp. SDB]
MGILLSFIVALIVSTIIIYAVTRFFGETEGITTALIAAVAGTVVYAVIYAILDHGLIAAFVAGIAWLLVLQHLYGIGWLKSLAIAVAIWLVTSVVGWFLPVL